MRADSHFEPRRVRPDQIGTRPMRKPSFHLPVLTLKGETDQYASRTARMITNSSKAVKVTGRHSLQQISCQARHKSIISDLINQD